MKSQLSTIKLTLRIREGLAPELVQLELGGSTESERFYSSNGVDRFVEQHLPDVGYACDVGASDGEFFSNTLHFEEKGWDVLCVEPNPKLAEAGKLKRKRWVCAACADYDGEADFTYYDGFPHASNSSLGIKPGYGAGSQPVTVKVPVKKLDTLLEEASFPCLDYLTIDVEGWEKEVLAGFSLDRWRPKVLVVESISYIMEAPPGYKALARMEFDNVFILE